MSDLERQNPATPRQREQAIQQGNLPTSHDFTSGLVLVGVLALFALSAHSIANALSQIATMHWSGANLWSSSREFSFTRESIVSNWNSIIFFLGDNVGVFLFGVFLIAVFVRWMPARFGFCWNRMAWNFGRLGINRSPGNQSLSNSLFRSGYNLLKFVIVLGVVAWCVCANGDQLVGIAYGTMQQGQRVIVEFLFSSVVKVSLALVVISVLDVYFQRWRFEQRIAMTDDQIKQEIRSIEVDPQILNRRRSIYQSMTEVVVQGSIQSANLVLYGNGGPIIGIRRYMKLVNPGRPKEVEVVYRGGPSMTNRALRQAQVCNIRCVENESLVQQLFDATNASRELSAELSMAVGRLFD